jgi:transposase-like protein
MDGSMPANEIDDMVRVQVDCPKCGCNDVSRREETGGFLAGARWTCNHCGNAWTQRRPWDDLRKSSPRRGRKKRRD